MSDLLSDLAQKAGISLDQAKTSMTAVLAALKGSLPADGFNQVADAVPDSAQYLNDDPAKPASGGLLGMLGKLLGGDKGNLIAVLLQKLGESGVSAGQVMKFVSSFIAFLKDKVPPDLLGKIIALFPVPGAEEKK